MTIREEYMKAAKTVAYWTMPGPDQPPLEGEETIIALTQGAGFELMLRGTPAEIIALAQRLHHVAARAVRVYADRAQP